MRKINIEHDSLTQGFYEFTKDADAKTFVTDYLKLVKEDAVKSLEGLTGSEAKKPEFYAITRPTIAQRTAIQAFDASEALAEEIKTASARIKQADSVAVINALSISAVTFAYYDEENIKYFVLSSEKPKATPKAKEETKAA